MDIYAPQFYVREALEGPAADDARQALFTALRADSRTLKQHTDRGLPPTEFAVARALQEALTAADSIVRRHEAIRQPSHTGDMS